MKLQPPDEIPDGFYRIVLGKDQVAVTLLKPTAKGNEKVVTAVKKVKLRRVRPELRASRVDSIAGGLETEIHAWVALQYYTHDLTGAEVLLDTIEIPENDKEET